MKCLKSVMQAHLKTQDAMKKNGDNNGNVRSE